MDGKAVFAFNLLYAGFIQLEQISTVYFLETKLSHYRDFRSHYRDFQSHYRDFHELNSITGKGFILSHLFFKY